MELRPFHGILYNPAHVHDLFSVLAPPYDVISQEEREVYYQQHPYNVVRLIYGRDEPGDTASQNRYTRAAQYLRTWLQHGVLQYDSQPAMYLCAEQYRLADGTSRQRQGLIALCRLEPYEHGIILPHEETSTVPKQMLLALRSTVEANLSQIFALYPTDTGAMQEITAVQRQRPPLFSFRDHDAMLHQVWAIHEPSVLQEIQRTMADRWALIADGHHRYETCLEYLRQRQRSSRHWSGEEWCNFVMIYLTDIHDPGLTILPTHRVLRGLPPGFVAQIPARLRRGCELEALPFHTPAERDAQLTALQHKMRRCSSQAHVFGLYMGTDVFWLLTCRDALALSQFPDAEPFRSVQPLDVTLLHDLLLPKVLGVDVREDMLAFTQDAMTAVDFVARGDYQVAVLLNATRAEQVLQYAVAHQRMPRKSTYFYPKLLTGIVLHKEVGDADHGS